jgi:hypothetical protein
LFSLLPFFSGGIRLNIYFFVCSFFFRAHHFVLVAPRSNDGFVGGWNFSAKNLVLPWITLITGIRDERRNLCRIYDPENPWLITSFEIKIKVRIKIRIEKQRRISAHTGFYSHNRNPSSASQEEDIIEAQFRANSRRTPCQCQR